MKLLAFVVALGCYASMHPTSNAQRTVQVSLIADLPPAGGDRALVSDIPNALSVTLEGPRQQLDDLEAKLDPITLNLSRAQDETIAFLPALIRGLPHNVRATRILPESLMIRWENVIERELEVQVSIAGQPAKGFKLRGEVIVSPKRLKARGPESVVKTLQLARTEAFELSGLTEGRHTRSLPLRAPPSTGSFDAASIEATLEVVPDLVTREFVAKVQLIGLPRGRAEPSTVRVLVSGTPERMATLRPDSLIARVDPNSQGIDSTKAGNALMPVIIDVAEAKAASEPAQVVVHW